MEPRPTPYNGPGFSMTKEKLMEMGLTEELGGGRAFSSIRLSLPPKFGLAGQRPFGGI